MAIIKCKIGSVCRRIYPIFIIFGMHTLVIMGHLFTEANLEIPSRLGDIAYGTLRSTS